MPDRFRAVEWEGTNLEEIRDVVGEERVLSSCSGLLSIRVAGDEVAGDEVAVAKVGWWVSRSADGEVTVSSGRVRATKWVPA